MRTHSDELDQALAGLESQARARVKGATLHVSSPGWVDGGTPLFSQDVRLRLEGALAALKIVRERATYTLEPRIGRHGDICRLFVTLVAAHGDRHPLKPINYHPGAFGGSRCDGPDMRIVSDDFMGLEAGRRVGASGLHVTLHVPTNAGVLCGGELFTPSVTVDERAWVRLYSVSSDGRVLWTGGPDEPVQGTWSPPKPLSSLNLGDKQYRLVAVATPEGEGPPRGLGLPQTKTCLSHAGLQASAFSASAALSAVHFTVLPPGHRECDGSPAVRDLHARGLAWLNGLSACD